MPADRLLQSRLKEETIDIGDLSLCLALVINDANYPWLLLVPRAFARKTGAVCAKKAARR
jgi:hypothetical protein